MENNNEAIDLNELTDKEIADKLLAIKLAAVGEPLTDIDDVVNQVLADAKLLHVKTGNYLKDNRNLVGGVIGLTLAVGLELISPTGSKKSAAVAAVTGGVALTMAAPFLKAAPQSAMVASGAGIMTAYVGMCGGRITADYFPGNLDNDE